MALYYAVKGCVHTVVWDRYGPLARERGGIGGSSGESFDAGKSFDCFGVSLSDWGVTGVFPSGGTNVPRRLVSCHA